MTTYIFNQSDNCVSQSHNLAGLFTWARKAKGVKTMVCHRFPCTLADYELSPGKVFKASRPMGYLVATLANGYKVETWFTSGTHLTDWANDRAKPRRNSWFSGATVETVDHPAWFNVFEFNRANFKGDTE